MPFLEWRPTFIVGAITAYIALMNQADATSRHFESFKHIYSGGAPIAPRSSMPLQRDLDEQSVVRME